jgi:hypothetical protein
MSPISFKSALTQTIFRRRDFAQVVTLLSRRSYAVAPCFKWLILLPMFVFALHNLSAQTNKRNPVASSSRNSDQAATATPLPAARVEDSAIGRIENRIAKLEEAVTNQQNNSLGRWGSWASIAGIGWSLILTAGVSWFIYRRTRQQAEEGLGQTIEKIEGTLLRLEELRNETQDGVTKLINEINQRLDELQPVKSYDEAINLVRGWFNEEDISEFEFFSPFSEVPLFWQDQTKARHIADMLIAKQASVVIKLIGPALNDFQGLCAIIAENAVNADPSLQSARLSEWVAKARKLSKHLRAKGALDTANKEPADRNDGKEDVDNAAIVDAMKEIINSDYYSLAVRHLALSGITPTRSEDAAKLRIGYAYAKFSTRQSARPNDNCRMIVFSNGEPEEQGKDSSSAITRRVLRLLATPVIYFTRNQLIMSGLRSAVEALTEQNGSDVSGPRGVGETTPVSGS